MKASTHPDAATLGAYHDGELRGALQADVAAHLSACAQCRNRVLQEGAVDDALRALPMMEPPDVHEELMACVTGARRRRSPRRPRRILVSVGAVLAALLALLAGYDAAVQVHGPAVAVPAAVPHAALSVPHVPTHGPTMFAPADGAPSSHGAASGPAAASPRQPASSSLAAPAGRLIVRSGQVDLRVPDVQRAFRAVTALASREGGYVADSFDVAAGAGNATSARLTLRVPASRFQAAMDSLVALPHDRVTQQSNSTDITDQYHNLQAQLQALQATRAQLLGLMRHAATVRDAMSVLDRLTTVDTGIDATQGQLLAQANSVMLSTIAVTLSPHPRQQPVVAPLRKQEPWQPGRTLADALSNLARAVQAIATVAIYLAVYLALPALLVVPFLLTRRLRRRPYRGM